MRGIRLVGCPGRLACSLERRLWLEGVGLPLEETLHIEFRHRASTHTTDVLILDPYDRVPSLPEIEEGGMILALRPDQLAKRLTREA